MYTYMYITHTSYICIYIYIRCRSLCVCSSIGGRISGASGPIEPSERDKWGERIILMIQILLRIKANTTTTTTITTTTTTTTSNHHDNDDANSNALMGSLQVFTRFRLWGTGGEFRQVKIRASHLSNMTCLRHVFFKSGELFAFLC